MMLFFYIYNMKINSTIKIYQFNKKNINEISIGETFIMDGIKYTSQKREDLFYFSFLDLKLNSIMFQYY